METVIDPELGIDIVNLGLVYEIRFEQNGHNEIDMTLTMGCPLADLLTDQIHVQAYIPGGRLRSSWCGIHSQLIK